MPKKNSEPKDPFADLDQEFKDAIDSGTYEEVCTKLAQVVVEHAELMEKKELDLDLKEKQEAAKAANEQYAESTKMNKLRIKYAKQSMEARGQRVPASNASLAERQAKRELRKLSDSLKADGASMTITMGGKELGTLGAVPPTKPGGKGVEGAPKAPDDDLPS